MLKQVAKKVLPSKIYTLLARTIHPPKKIVYYSPIEMGEKILQFGLKKIAILTDGQTDIKALCSQSDILVVGVYSFNLDIIDTKIETFTVHPLLPNSNIFTNGWIVSSKNETDTFALNSFLLQSSKENQIILQHVKLSNSTKYYSYIDFFSGSQETIVQINNYFRRCYALAFPIDLRLTLRDLNGKVKAIKQIILAPDEIGVIRSTDFQLGNFAGYMEVEFELAKKITPFLHYMADYFAPEFISSNHQSGLGLHPAGSEFTRGYIPTEENKTLFVCLFQHHYKNPIVVKAILNYTDKAGKSLSIEKHFPPLHKKQMLYVDVKKIFKEIDFSKIIAPVIVTKSDLPLHRPNYYYAIYDKEGYYDTSHAGPDLKNHVRLAYKGIAEVASVEKNKLGKYGIESFDLKHHVLPKEFEMDSIIYLVGNDTTCPINNFRMDLYDMLGKLIHSFEDTFGLDREKYLNINNYLEKLGLSDFSGTISFRPGNNASQVPISAESITGYIHKKSGYLTSTAGNGCHPDNIPFYFRAGPPNHMRIKCSAGTTDIFARGIFTEDFDTYFTVSFQSADKALRKKIKYEIQITNTQGEKKIVYRELNQNGYDLLKLSQLVNESGLVSKEGFFTVWLFCGEAHLYAQHILYRKSDSAIALEHCYAGKFGL